jgi:hypothetical protein
MIPSCGESVKNISGVKIEENQLDKNGTTLRSVKNNFQVPHQTKLMGSLAFGCETHFWNCAR